MAAQSNQLVERQPAVAEIGEAFDVLGIDAVAARADQIVCRQVREPLGGESAETAISIMLIVPDADAAIAWYRDALGAVVAWDLGGVAGACTF